MGSNNLKDRDKTVKPNAVLGWLYRCTLQLLHLLLPAGDVHVGALPLVIDLLQARAVLAEGCLDLQLLLNGSVRQLQADNSISATGREVAETS